MQILESSLLGLRTARMVFRKRGEPVSITLYPVVHVGEARFYDEVFADAFSHDIVLVEGVSSPVGRNLTRTYRWLNFDRLGLVRQPKTPSQETVAGRIILADLSTEEFHQEWRQVSLVFRAALAVLAPVMGLLMRVFATRERLANNMSMEDRQSSDEVLQWSPRNEPLFRSILHARDERLIECLIAAIDSSKDLETRIAIIYGARHMRAVTKALTHRGFHCAEASWRIIFSL